jgi:phage gp45-like
MNMMLIRDLAAKLRNLFCVSELQKRYEDGKVQIKTHNGKVLEKCESFPYGFYAKAKNGKAMVFCQGGNYNDFEILPVMKADDIPRPELKEGDSALYTGDGGCVIVRDAGDVEVLAMGSGKVKVIAKDGTLFFANDKTNSCKILLELIDEIKGLITTGSPATQTINAASQQKLEAYKNKVKDLYAEAE